MATLEEQAIDARQFDTIIASAGDPMRPGDIVIATGVQSAPPCCPACLKMLQPMSNNAVGDIRFECMGDGYIAIYRVATNEYEQWAGAQARRWTSPLTLSEARQRSEGHAPRTDQPLPKQDPAAREYTEWMGDARQ